MHIKRCSVQKFFFSIEDEKVIKWSENIKFSEGRYKVIGVVEDMENMKIKMMNLENNGIRDKKDHL